MYPLYICFVYSLNLSICVFFRAGGGFFRIFLVVPVLKDAKHKKTTTGNEQKVVYKKLMNKSGNIGKKIWGKSVEKMCSTYCSFFDLGKGQPTARSTVMLS